MSTKHKHALATVLAFAAGMIASPRLDRDTGWASWTTVWVVSIWALLIAASALLDSTRDDGEER